MCSLSLIVLKTHQIDKVVEFYRAIGVPFQQEQHGTGPVHFAALFGDLVFEVYPGATHADATLRLGFKVASLTDVLAALQLLGIETIEPRQSSWGPTTIVRDPDGRVVEMTQG